MKNKFFFAFPTAVLGGAERVMFNLIMMLLKNDHHVTVYIMSRGEQSGWNLIKDHPNLTFVIKNYKSEKTSLPMFLLSLFYLSYKNEYDYAFSSHTHVNGVLSFMRRIKFFRVKYLISRESTVIFERFYGIWRIIFKLIYRFMYGKQDLIICQTEKMKASLIENLGYRPAKRIEVISNPVNLDYIDKQLTSTKILRKPFLNLIIGCGRLIALKKFDLLILAFAGISNKFPEAGLVIIGDGPEKYNLLALVESLNIKNKVIFTGKINNPIQWFAQGDIGVISSEIEGFPNVLIEMMASGTKHIITTPCSDGVYAIPNINITSKCSTLAIQESIDYGLTHLFNQSIENRAYIYEHRSVESFWNSVEKLLIADIG